MLSRRNFPDYVGGIETGLNSERESERNNHPSSYRPLGMIDTTGLLFKKLDLNIMKIVIEERGNDMISPKMTVRRRISTQHALQEVQERVSKALYELPDGEGYCAIIALVLKIEFNSANWK